MIVTDQETATPAAPLADATRNGVLSSTLRRLLCTPIDVMIGGVRHIESNMVPISVCGAIMYPAYWFVWKYLFPQPYENISLRLVGAALFLFIAVKDHWPASWRSYLPVVWLGTMTYSLFFFAFMTLQNGVSSIWVLSELCAIFLSVLVLDWFGLVFLFLVGSLLAWRIHLLVSSDSIAVSLHLEFVPILLFTIIAGSVFSYKAAGLRQARERARLDLGALIAKEMKSPLFGVRTHAVSLSKFLPGLVNAYLARRPSDDVAPPMAESQLHALERVPARLEEAVDQISGIIDTLLGQAGQSISGTAEGRMASIAHCVDEAIGRLPLRSDLERGRISLYRDNDFRFEGSPTLLIRVLARLLENSLNSAAGHASAKVEVSFGQAGTSNYLRVCDASATVRPLTAMGLFQLGFARTNKDFSDRPDLAFAKLVMEQMGGSLSWNTGLGGGSEVVLWFRSLGTS
jgi:two-component system, CAI-1 autoinducer sensor kinase/phosphatase CqsS